MNANARERRSSWAARIGLLVVASVTLSGAAGAATNAYAADAAVSVSNARLTQGGTAVTDGQTIGLNSILRLDAEWAVGSVQAGDSFVIELPSAFSRLDVSAPFQLMAADGVTPVADCIWSDGAPDFATCTFLNDYSSAQGTIFFEMQAADVQSEQPVTVVIGGSPVVLPRVSVDVIGWTPPTEPEKWATATIDEDDRAFANWLLVLPLGSEGADVSDTLTQLAGDRPHRLLRDTFTLYEFTDVRNGEIFETPGSKISYTFTLSGDTTTINTAGYSGEFDFTGDLAFDGTLTGLNPEHLYQIGYSSASTDLVSVTGDAFSNRVELNGKEITSSVEARATAGGGASTTGFMSISISKRLIDEDRIVSGVDAYPVTLSYNNLSTSISVPADGTEVSGPRVPSGTIITLCEQLPAVAGVTWLPYSLAGPGVEGPDASGCYTVRGDTDVDVILTNTASPAVVPTGTFSVTKEVTGPGARLVPSTTKFAVEYSTAGDNPISGTLIVTSNGEVVTGPQLPVGSVVTLSEAVPPAVDGVTWGTPRFSGADVTVSSDNTATVTVGDSTNTAVRLTNTASPVAVPPTPGIPPMKAGELSETGGQPPIVLAVAGAVLLVLGVSALALMRRRPRDETSA